MSAAGPVVAVSEPAVRRVLTRRRALALGAVAVGGTVVAGRAVSAEAAAGGASVELGPATVLQRNASAAPAAPVPNPSPPPAQVAAYRPSFVRFAFAGNTAAAGSDRWQWQGLQGDRAKPAGVPHLLVYATAVQRPSDPKGITQCMTPAEVQPDWFLLDTRGNKLHRGSDGSGGDYALDPGNPAFQQRSATFLLAKCRREGWSGVLHDEINGDLSWAFPGQQSAKYPTSELYRQALLGYVRYLGAQFAAAGFMFAGNIGEALFRGWCEDLTRAGMVTSSETFVAGNVGRSGPMSAEDGLWAARVSWLEWSLANAPAVIMHDRQNDETPTLYGLCTFLLVDNGKGVYGASTGYSAADRWMDCFTAAQSLGSPLGPRVNVSGGLWRRDFQRGYVLVNSSTSAANHQGARLAPTSGSLVLN